MPITWKSCFKSANHKIRYILALLHLQLISGFNDTYFIFIFWSTLITTNTFQSLATTGRGNYTALK